MRSLHGRMLRYLDEVARHGSIRGAAARLSVSASSINRQLLALEAEMGVALFDRLPNRLRLTAAGEALVAHIRRTLADHERTAALIEEMRGSHGGTLTVAMMGGLGPELIARTVLAARAARPRMRLVFQRLSLADILAAVREGRADLGLAYGAEGQRGIATLMAWECRLGAVMPPDHPLAGHASLRLADLLAARLVLPAEGMSLRPLVEAGLARGGLRPDPIVEANEVEVMKRIAVLAQGVTLLNRLNIQPEEARGDLAFVPIEDRALPSQTLRLFTAERAAQPVLSGVFAEALRGVIEPMLAYQPSSNSASTSIGMSE
ncbi:LysR family transcriptional regulator [Falsiroseomonas ponticola]|uniref:LysR family transcriptional regulator n=1 Tax=Falsiroseomonas ponticola TaxID=2786951 RepID=UPI00193449A1|nr:LysR family transcriptional regulator [Roseomonas ponticola]